MDDFFVLSPFLSIRLKMSMIKIFMPDICFLLFNFLVVLSFHSYTIILLTVRLTITNTTRIKSNGEIKTHEGLVVSTGDEGRWSRTRGHCSDKGALVWEWGGRRWGLLLPQNREEEAKADLAGTEKKNWGESKSGHRLLLFLHPHASGSVMREQRGYLGL